MANTQSSRVSCITSEDGGVHCRYSVSGIRINEAEKILLEKLEMRGQKNTPVPGEILYAVGFADIAIIIIMSQVCDSILIRTRGVVPKTEYMQDVLDASRTLIKRIARHLEERSSDIAEANEIAKLSREEQFALRIRRLSVGTAD